jgi:cob(I)alamin adenosyltransferase
MKIYTKTGDDGTTGLLGSLRVLKTDSRIEAYGTVDELNASVGLARSIGVPPELDERLGRIQEELFSVGAALADVSTEGRFQSMLSESLVNRLENEIDAMEAELGPLTNFILPGGSPVAAHLHLSRCICRRAERLVEDLNTTPGLQPRPKALVYLNRLSDWLFVAARWANKTKGVTDVIWKGN